MQDFSRPLGDTVRAARIDHGYTQKQLVEKIDVDERSISSIEKYQANTTMEILYPLIRVLRIDPREIIHPELGRESKSHYQLRLLLENCTETEATALLSIVKRYFRLCVAKMELNFNKKEPASPVIGRSWLCVSYVWLTC